MRFTIFHSVREQNVKSVALSVTATCFYGVIKIFITSRSYNSKALPTLSYRQCAKLSHTVTM